MIEHEVVVHLAVVPLEGLVGRREQCHLSVVQTRVRDHITPQQCQELEQ